MKVFADGSVIWNHQSMSPNRVDLIAYQEIFNSSGFFRNLSKEVLFDLMNHIEVKKISASDTVLKEGQENFNLYFLLEGLLGVYVHGEKVTEISGFGEIIGEISLINSIKASATVKAEKDTTVLVCKIHELKKEAPHILKEFEGSQFKLFSAILADRLVVTNEKARSFEIANKELIAAKRELEKINRELESRVLERTAEIAEKNRVLEEIIKSNQQLVRVLCHDLNNTLSVVQLTSSLAVKNSEQLNPAQHLEMWKRVQRAALKEKDLIAYVREFIAIESGKKDLTLSEVDLVTVMESCRFLFQDKLIEKELQIVEELPPKMSVLAEAVSLTHSVINNIISNAIKFSPRGKKIFIKGSDDPQNKLFCLSIADQGIGIPAEILENLFSLNKKTSRQGTEGESGTGFGMPLVYATMKAYNGNIEVSSQENQGTVFRLFFQQP